MAITPSVRMRGRYTLKAPWVADPGKVYECEAIRSFDDLSKLGIDPYETYYLPMGLQDGQVYAGVPFSYSAEETALVNIVTLKSQDGTYLYVPDSYILSIPDMSGVPYSQMVISLNLGALPDYLDLAALKTDLANRAHALIGATVTPQEHRAPSTHQPTPAEHDVLEAARLAAVTATTTDYVELQKALSQIVTLNATIAALVAKLQALGGI